MTHKVCALDGCMKKARRKFCSNRHKDRYHNEHNPRGKFAHLRDRPVTVQLIEDDMHPHDPYALGQWDD